MPKTRGGATGVLDAFSPQTLTSAMAAGDISGADYTRMVNIGTLLRSLHARGGFGKGPEHFSDPRVLGQRAQMLMALGREHPLITQSLDLTGQLKEAQRAREVKPRVQPPATTQPPERQRRGWTYQPAGDILRQLAKGQSPWLLELTR